VPTDKRARQKAARRQKIEAERRAAKRQSTTRRVVVVVLIAAVVVGSVALFASSSSKAKPKPTFPLNQTAVNQVAVAAGCPASPSTTVNTFKWSSAPKMTINTATTYYAHVVSTQGPFVIKLNAAAAPITVNNFVFLANQKYYNCVTFHRVIPDFVVQGGDPTGTGTGGPGYTIPDELPKAGSPTYPLYSVAMANAGANTGGSQFFIVTGASGEQLPPKYSLFGQVVSGTKAVGYINQQGSQSGVPPTVTNRMLSVTISTKP
jgi:cyclophilin family peptidyl-prolyl cis-trans isomerase